MNNLDRISDRQLQAMHGNLRAWDRKLRSSIRLEWEIRGLTETSPIVDEFHKEIQSNLTKPLPWKWRTLVMAIPFVLLVNMVAGAQMLDRGYHRMFRDLYLFMAMGFGLWYVVVILLWSVLG